ncbi:prenyltransferase [Streptomyces antnestii]|uniref:Prenyltransferase n=1 Tax=Streptomyces antnestii TaxID=2494256 RepID=A0A3S2XZ02_9ACTN|nr:UbiA family prenyltransferase [Streptomyces sp. San01]RVU28797.1 prenyltransferase [Streptomyces sp. San01]
MSGRTGQLRAWAELLRLPALFTVPGDALAGASAMGLRPGRGTLLAVGSSLCLYEAGMALNDWADRDEDAVDRPHRPLPSGRIRPAAALTAAAAFTAAGLTLAHRAGRPASLLAGALATTVWSYDLALKHTPAGPATMATARGLDVLLGAAATATCRAQAPRPAAATPASLRSGQALRTAAATLASLRSGQASRTAAATPLAPGCGQAFRKAMGVPPLERSREWGRVGTAPRAGRPSHGLRAALPAAATVAAHTLAVTTVSRNETQGGNTLAPLGALAATLTLTRLTARTHKLPAGRRVAAAPGLPGSVTTALAAAYAAATTRPYLHAALNPSPPLTQRAVGAGIKALIPLQAALAAKAGAPGTALLTAALAPLAQRIAPKVSVT